MVITSDGGGSGMKFFKIILTWNHGCNHADTGIAKQQPFLITS